MERLIFRELSEQVPDDIKNVQTVFDAAPQYHLLVEGRIAASDAAIKAMSDLPPGKLRIDKIFGCYFLDSSPVGCLDIVRGYPESYIAFIGLLLFDENHQGLGFGKQAMKYITDIAHSWQCHVLRIGVVETNSRAVKFWKREGFSEIYRKSNHEFTGDIIVMEKHLEINQAT
ncbi:MAG: GNAT family N-acetyltransferase [Candidatus Riflebacteria bacterium]|nr:GNAT family N-acetyltransferase [Candidatus Riflebacteria bacterium]